MIQPERIKKLKEISPDNGKFILYWMQSAQRVKNNHALEFATQLANNQGVPLVVCIVLMPAYPSANKRHYRFMIEGLESLSKALEQIGAKVIIQYGEVLQIVERISKHAAAIVMDDAISRPIRHLKEEVVAQAKTTVYQVETNVIVPVEVAYPKEAYAAYAIRNALNRRLHAFAIDFNASKVNCIDDDFRSIESIETLDTNLIINAYYKHLPDLDDTICLKGGENEALSSLIDFVDEKLIDYEAKSSDPSVDATSKLSAYLHFGQISPVTIHESVKNANMNSGAFIEQLFVRRELAYNFVHYNDHYDQELGAFLPNWAVTELNDHKDDTRPYLYTAAELEAAQTHDIYWNAAQTELVLSGFIHNTMRMYWGKKIIEWTQTFEEAFRIMIELNDKYALDGRDPNGYAGIAWCFGKHDRPFQSRSIFGKVRYMNAKGLQRKYDMSGYLKRVEKMGGINASI